MTGTSIELASFLALAIESILFGAYLFVRKTYHLANGSRTTSGSFFTLVIVTVLILVRRGAFWRSKTRLALILVMGTMLMLGFAVRLLSLQSNFL